MKNMYKLMNYQFVRMVRKASLIYAAMMAMQIIFFMGNIEKYSGHWRFEQLLDKSGYGISFMVAFILILTVIALSIYELYMASGSVYTILSLPLKPWQLYLSFLVPALIVLTILCLCQMLSVLIAANLLPHAMNNHIFLAFLRYEPIRTFYPTSILNLLRSIILLISPAVTVLYSAFSERSRRLFNFVLVFIWAMFYLNLTGIIGGAGNSVENSIFLLIITPIITVLFIADSIKYLRDKSVTGGVGQ